MTRAVVPLIAAGCLSYTPGSYRDVVRAWPGQRVTLDCLDLAVQVVRDDQVPGPVVEYAFGNRCERDVPVDLGAARVVVRDDDGREHALAAYDPGHELRSVALPARMTGRERVAYDGDFGERDLAQVCVDVGAIALGSGPRWICRGERLEARR
jgi:hypothetical protein